MSNPLILVTDDEPANRAFVRNALSAAGWTVIEAEDGQEAIAAAKSFLPHLIIMDINMQKSDGFSATAAIRALDGPIGAVPILAYTTMPLTDDTVRAAGMDGRLAKPTTVEALVEGVAPWRPDSEMAGAERLAQVFGEDEIKELVLRLRGQLAEAVEALDEEGNLATAHRIAGAAGTLGFIDVSSSWFRLSEGDLSAREDARRDARIAIAAIDRDLAPQQN